jgi:hypothetical protein
LGSFFQDSNNTRKEMSLSHLKTCYWPSIKKSYNA